MGRRLLVIAIVVTTVHQASAQFGANPPGGGYSGAPPAPPPKCQGLLNIRDELQEHANAIETARSKTADVKVACPLFRTYIATEAKMLGMLEADGPSCGVPPQTIQQVRDNHTKAQQTGKQVCDAAALGSD